METQKDFQERFIRLPELQKLLPLGKSTIWAKVKQGKLPSPVKISQRVSAWRYSDIVAYIDNLEPKGGNA
ncbi:MAG: AlpA family phage regulatory protein [Dehalococcoidia bacterium]|nr:AlpA family phage regulatory protein [Dehalococcoidia bacterium]